MKAVYICPLLILGNKTGNLLKIVGGDAKRQVGQLQLMVPV
jgi:hypothetical protein